MWKIRKNRRYVDRTNFDNNFGPDYGIDYARFADLPNPEVDKKLAEEILIKLNICFRLELDQPEIIVRNGFVILKGFVPDEMIRSEISKEVSRVYGVKEVINQLLIRKH